MSPTDRDLRLVELLPGGEHITSRPLRFVATLDDRGAVAVQAQNLRASADMVPVLSAAIATASAFTGTPVATLGSYATEDAEARKCYWTTAEIPRPSRPAGQAAPPGVSLQGGPDAAAAVRGVIADMEVRITRSLEHTNASATLVGGHYYRDDYALGCGEGYRRGLREAVAALRDLLSGGSLGHEGAER